MIFTRLHIKNIQSFTDTTFDFTLKREIKNSTVEHEYLPGREKFRYKRVVIISGANATGKTSLGRILLSIQLHLLNIKPISLTTDSFISVDFVLPDKYFLCRFEIKNIEDSIYSRLGAVPITVNDSAQKSTEKLNEVFQKKEAYRGAYYKDELLSNYSLKKDDFFKSFTCGWYYLFSGNKTNNQLEELFFKTSELLNKILKTYDSTINKVSLIKNEEGEYTGFQIKFSNGDTVEFNKEGKAANPERLSRGTYDAVSVVHLLQSIIHGQENCFFFLDEKMAFAHSELEQAMVNLIIEKLGKTCQFFYTTHNYDILDMNLPVHSYLFLTGDKDKNIEAVHPEESFKQNDRRLLNYIKNDVFNTLPNTESIDSLL